MNFVDEFFLDDPFTVTVSYNNGAGSTKNIIAIFDDKFHFTPVESMTVPNLTPKLTCKTSDVSDATSASTVVVNGSTYYVKEPQPDGTGITVLILSSDPNS